MYFNNELPMIYIAGPISNGGSMDIRAISANVKKAEYIYMSLIEKGFSPICPHLSVHPWSNWERDVDWQTWMKMDEVYVRACPSFFYMSPEKYGASKGALHELGMARELGKTIYSDLDKVPDITNKSYDWSDMDKYLRDRAAQSHSEVAPQIKTDGPEKSDSKISKSRDSTDDGR